MAQPVEPGEEPIDHKFNRSRFGSTHNSTGRGPGKPPTQPIEGTKNFLFIPERLFNLSRLTLNRLRSGRGPVEAQRSPAKH